MLAPARYKGIFGGRGSGKSHERAEAVVEAFLINPDTRFVGLREVQKSIAQSVKHLIESKIRSFEAEDYFDIKQDFIRAKKGNGLMMFMGMANHTAETIKSLDDVDIAWFEEAQSASQKTLDLLRPTIRNEKSELWFTWNPGLETDPIDMLLRGPNPPPGSIVVRVNYDDNPWFPSTLKEEMEYDKRRDPDKYAHIWLGEYQRNSEARVFKNWRIEEFETDPKAMLSFGADWGYAQDPTCLVRSYIVGRTLYVDYEAYQIGCTIDSTPFLFAEVPASDRWPIVADSGNPQMIKHMKDHGYPKIYGAVKGPNSVMEGVEFLKSMDIVVHPRCRHTIDELTLYSYKIDPKTSKVLPVLEDKKNHIIDSLRYSHEGARRYNAARKPEPTFTPTPTVKKWN